MRVSTLLSLAALLTSTVAITSTTVLTPVEQSPYYYLGCYPFTADVAVGAYNIPDIATGYNNGNPVDCQIGCDQQYHAPYLFMYGTYCYCQVREVEFDIHQPGGAPVDNSFCTTPCFVDPNAPCGTFSNTDGQRYVTVYGKYGPRASFSPRVSSTSSTRSTVVTSSSISTVASSISIIASTSTSSTPQSRSLAPIPRPPYSYLGCYSFVSVQSGAIWQFQSTAVGDPVACQAACDAVGSPFLMMLFDSCYCQPASYGINAPPGLPAADSECSIACRNSPGSPCGGSASGLFYTVYGGRQPGVSSSNMLPSSSSNMLPSSSSNILPSSPSNMLPSTTSRLTSTRTSTSSTSSPSVSLTPDPLPPYNYLGCYYMLDIYNPEVFTLQYDISGNPIAIFGKFISIGAVLGWCLHARTHHVHPRLIPDIIDNAWELEHLYNIEIFGSLYISPEPGHFGKLNLCNEPKQHGSGYEVLNVYLHHGGKVRNVHIHQNNHQRPPLFCEVIHLKHFDYSIGYVFDYSVSYIFDESCRPLGAPNHNDTQQHTCGVLFVAIYKFVIYKHFSNPTAEPSCSSNVSHTHFCTWIFHCTKFFAQVINYTEFFNQAINYTKFFNQAINATYYEL
ncbi:hypothetical protein CcaCcLH18_08319 [Colletotrichum camelliae]|nr:hypothetical protein CcaCcLH18_08319 [Colletotrichum camelliae]